MVDLTEAQSNALNSDPEVIAARRAFLEAVETAHHTADRSAAKTALASARDTYLTLFQTKAAAIIAAN